MTGNERLHLDIRGATHRELGEHRGALLRVELVDAYRAYAELFRALGVSENEEADGAARALAAVRSWRPAVADELEGLSTVSSLELHRVVALNARTEIIAMGGAAARECSTFTSARDGQRFGVQTWDWHIELDPYWHTHTVHGPGIAYAGLTEQGILGKIGINAAGLALHLNILGHRDDGPDGVPMHVLSRVVLAECASIAEALAVIRSAPIDSSSAFTLVEAARAVSVEMSPAGVYVIEEHDGSVQRTNNFQNPVAAERQKSALYEPDSSERLALLRERLRAAPPTSDAAMVRMLETAEGEAPLTCRPDMSLPLGERWATLATIVTDPVQRRIQILDGTPVDAPSTPARVIELSDSAAESS